LYYRVFVSRLNVRMKFDTDKKKWQF